MKLYSNAFSQGHTIPTIHTCVGHDQPIPLRWEDAPPHTASFILICDDPDAPMGTWDHWLLYNIPANVNHISDSLPPHCQSGINSWGKLGYGGPCPPDREHRYFFYLYALDTMLHFDQAPNKQKLHDAMHGHILAEAQLMGRFVKP